MPILLLLIVALASGLLIALAFDRLAPARGATAAVADAAESMAEASRLRLWWRARIDAGVLTGLALTAAVAMMIGGGLVLGVLAYLVRGNRTLASLDSSVAHWGNDHATQLSTRLLTWVTDFGDWPIVPLLGLALLIYEWRRAPSRYLLPFLLVVYAGDKLITNGIKDLVDRARPTLNPIAETLGPSFPSGHSSTAASFYAALALILARRRGARVRALLAGSAAAIAVAVAVEPRAARRALAVGRDRGRHARLGLVRALRGGVRGPPALASPSRSSRPRGGAGDAGRSSPPAGPPGRQGVDLAKSGKPAA